MKLRMLVSVAAIAFLVSCGPSYQVTDSSVVVPVGTRSAFADQYPTAGTVVWGHFDPAITPLVDWELTEWPELDADDYVVTFNIDGVPHYAWYDEDGSWIGTARTIGDVTTVPVSINTMVTTKFPGYTISTVKQEFWPDDRMGYELELKSGDTKVKLLVDQNGNILKQKMKVDD
ncbi:MAG TPA: PepSY-like domain-containing protein [Chitinophagaceae bacterium]|nr:PepSY-like domain-containing protein [Chitinophagaceae bacterium]